MDTERAVVHVRVPVHLVTVESQARLPMAQFRPHDLARPAPQGAPAPPVAYRLDQQKSPAALVVQAAAPDQRTTRKGIPDLDQDTIAVGGQPNDHHRHPGLAAALVVLGVGRYPDGIGDQFTDDQLGSLRDTAKAPLGQYRSGMQPSARHSRR